MREDAWTEPDAALRGNASERLRLSGLAYPIAVAVWSRAVTVLAAYVIALAARGLSFRDVFTRWDGGWFLFVIEDGYPTTIPEGTGAAGTSSIAFFPGYPLAVRAFSFVTTLPPDIGGIAVSMIASVAATVVIWILAKRLFDERVADRTAVLFSFFPSAYVFSMVYSDALYLLFVAASLLSLLQRRWLLAGLTAAVAGSIRANALVLLVPCLWAAFEEIRTKHSWRAMVAPVLVPVGTLAYFAYLWAHTGDAMAFFRVESRGWDQRFDFGVSNVVRLIEIVSEGEISLYHLVLTMFVVGTAGALLLTIRSELPTLIKVYVVGIVALALLASNTTSVPRFLLSAFPVLMPIAARLTERWYTIVAATFGAFMVVLFALAGATEVLAP